MDPRRRALLILPWAVTAALVAVLALLLPGRTTGHLLVYAGLSFFALGKLVILGPAIDPTTPLSPLALAGLAVYLDLLTVLTVGPHLALLHRIPWLGRRLQALEADMRGTLERRPWVRRWTLLSVAFFIVVPLAGMGALGATILGRLSGLTFRALFWAATAGSLAGSGIFLLFARPALRLLEPVQGHPLLRWSGLALAALFVAVGAWRLRRKRGPREGSTDGPAS